MPLDNVADLVQDFEARGGKVEVLPAHQETRVKIYGSVVAINPFYGQNGQVKGSVFTVRQLNGIEKRLISEGKWAVLISMGAQYEFTCEINKSNHTADQASYRCVGKPTLLGQTTNPSYG